MRELSFGSWSRVEGFVIWLVLLLGLIGMVDLQAEGTMRENVIKHELDNGLRILIYPRHSSPTFSGRLIVNAGSKDEYLGITGIAHMFEHVAFKGTNTIGALDYEKEKPLLEKIDRIATELTRLRSKNSSEDKQRVEELTKIYKELGAEHIKLMRKNEFGDIYKRNGGQGLNATTGQDFTNYFINLPANRLELWMWMESDRLLNPVMREFYTERDVIREERNMRVENNPNGKMWEVFLSTAFQSHPYGYPVLGWIDDMESLTLTKADAFWRRYYVPSNMIVVLVGDLDPEKTIALAEKYFGRLPAGEGLERPVPAREREQIGERRFEIVQKANPILIIGYHKPTIPDRADEVADVTQMVLSGGRTSRLYKSLILDKQLATGIWSFTTGGAKYDNLFMIYGVPRAPHTVTEIEEAIYEELERLADKGPTELELERVKNNLEADYIRGLQSNAGLAGQLAFFTALTGDPYYLDGYVERLKTVSAQEVQDFIRSTLTKQNRTVGWIVKEEEPK